MATGREGALQSAELVVACPRLGETLELLVERLGFRLESIWPAEDPAVAVVSGGGVRVRLVRDGVEAPSVLRVALDDPRALVGGGETTIELPGGLRIELVEAQPPVVLPPLAPSFTLTRLDDGPRWIDGRAGMRYRDLIPDRQGGRFVASHIQIREAGPVADYVHFHRVQFQMIYCWRGSVRVVYEDQGAPFMLRAGDCVLQPPQIRHRVLQSSADLEVIEVGAPALHETRVDHALTLPTETVRPERRFEGQRFVRHEAGAATWRPWRLPLFEARDSGIAAATDHVASVEVVRARAASSPAPQPPQQTHAADLRFWFVLDGELTIDCQGRARERLYAGDALVIPAALPHALAGWSAELQLLEVTLPG